MNLKYFPTRRVSEVQSIPRKNPHDSSFHRVLQIQEVDRK